MLGSIFDYSPKDNATFGFDYDDLFDLPSLPGDEHIINIGKHVLRAISFFIISRTKFVHDQC
jgi:hypothetical protein